MHPRIPALEQLPDHVQTAAGVDAMAYLAVVALWLGGVAMLIVRKLREA